MKNKIALIYWIVFFPITLFGQNHSNWFQTNLPLGTEYTKKEDLLKEVNFSQNKKHSKRIEKEFIEVNDYYIDRFLNSGMVITSSPATNYISLVADKLLSGNSELRSKLKFYLVYTTEVNAFTFTNGMIFVNVGLFARLKNEAQLAYILSHEIAHFQLQHSFEKYTMNEEVNSNEDEKEFLEIVLSKFSRDKEFEADKVGFQLFMNSGYRLAEAKEVFDVLHEADFPLENKSIPKTVFEGKYLKIPKSFYSDSLISIALPIEENDTNSTHPNSKKRKELIEGFIPSGSTDGKDFLVSSTQFEAIKNAAQIELSPAYLLEGNYISSLYNTEILLSRFPNNEILIENKIKAIYFLLANINFGTAHTIIHIPRKVNGEIRKFHQLFKKLNSEEVNALGLRIAWDLHKAYPYNKEIKRYCDGITYFFAEKVSSSLNYFAPLNTYNEDSIQSFYTKTVTEVKQKRYTGNTTIRKDPKRKENFAKFSMCDYLGDIEFNGTFKEIALRVSENKNSVSNEINLETDELESTAGEKDNKKKKPSKSKLKSDEDFDPTVKIQKILIIDISSFNIDLRSKKPIQYREQKSKQLELVQTVKEIGAMNNVEVVVFNPIKLTAQDSVLFNDRTILERWRKERLANSTMPEILPTEYLDLEKLCERYGTPYVGYITTGSIKVPNPNTAIMVSQLLYTCFHPVLFVLAMYSSFTTEKESSIDFPIYNIKTGAKVGTFGTSYQMGDHKDLFKAEFYNFFHSIKN